MDSGINTLRGARVLVVEDEYYLADDLARALADVGAEVVGPAGSIAEAERQIAAGGFDCAVLDVNLHGEFTYGIAERLDQLGLPYVIATGYNCNSLPGRLAGKPRVEKPFESGQVVDLLARTAERAGA